MKCLHSFRGAGGEEGGGWVSSEPGPWSFYGVKVLLRMFSSHAEIWG